MKVGSPRNKKRIILVAVAAAIAIAAIVAYMWVSINSIMSGYAAPVYPGVPSIAAQVFGSRMLLYSMSTSIVPYVLVHYAAVNASYVKINATLYSQPIPGEVYVLNTSGGLCAHCTNVSAVESHLQGYLAAFGTGYQVRNISLVNLASIQNNSILVVPTGRMLWQILNGTSGKTLLDSLLVRGTSVIYVGVNFSQICALGGSCSVLTQPPVAEPYLATLPAHYRGTSFGMRSFNFNDPTFTFSGGLTYGPLTYIHAYNGTVVAFSNYPDSWPADKEAFDIAKAISEEFWLNTYASGSVVVLTNGSSSGTVGILLNSTSLNFGANSTSPSSLSYLIGRLAAAQMRITLYNNAGYGVGNRSAYAYLQYSNTYPMNGMLFLPSYVLPNQNTAIGVTLFQALSNMSLNFRINRASDFRLVSAFSPQSFTVQPYQQFNYYQRFFLPPGSYIISLLNLTNYTYASGLFTVPPLNITTQSADFQANNYTFLMEMANIPLSGINYTVTFDNCAQCPSYSGVVLPNGTAFYSPQGTHTNEILGKLNFTFHMLGANTTYTIENNPVKIVVTGPEIELAIVVVIMLVLVIAVKAPNRDEFYIDVPVMPKPETIEVKLKPAEVLSTFDKLNMYYHWQYMPLSVEEVKNAIRMNIRVGNMPVTVTYNNAESVLNELRASGDVVACDSMYAPKEWTSLSGHDIEYLATFKKLRVWLVTHAYMFTDVNASEAADMVVTAKGERAYVIIYSQTSKFKDVPMAKGAQTYIAFINSEKMLEFRDALGDAEGDQAELLRMYVSSGRIRLMDADNPGAAFAS